MRAAHLCEAAAATPHYQRRRPEQTPLYRLVREHYETFAAEMERHTGGGAGLPQFVKDEFAAYLDCGILAAGFLRLTCDHCARDTLVAFSCKRRGICPSCGTRRMAETAADLVDNILPRVPVRQWVLSFPISLRGLFAVRPELITLVLQIIHRVINTFLIQQTGVPRTEAASGGVNLAGDNFHHAEMRNGKGANNLISFLGSGREVDVYRFSGRRMCDAVETIPELHPLLPLNRQPRTATKHDGWWFEQYVQFFEPNIWRWNTNPASKIIKKVVLPSS